MLSSVQVLEPNSRIHIPFCIIVRLNSALQEVQDPPKVLGLGLSSCDYSSIQQDDGSSEQNLGKVGNDTRIHSVSDI